MDSQRVMSWMNDPNRKPANVAFTEGDERQAAYLIEMAQEQAKAQVKELRETVKRLNRRCQDAESAANVKVEDIRKQGGSFGRALAAWSAGEQRRRAETAEARVSALTTDVMRLTTAIGPHMTVDSSIKFYNQTRREWADAIRLLQEVLMRHDQGHSPCNCPEIRGAFGDITGKQICESMSPVDQQCELAAGHQGDHRNLNTTW